MRLIKAHTDAQPLRLTEAKLAELASWLGDEIEAAFASRHAQEIQWREAMRRYTGTPKQKQRKYPIPNAPNLTVPLSATTTDAIYAQILDLVFTADPVITVRATRNPEDPERVNDAKALQDWVDHSVVSRYALRRPVENAVFEGCQLGTGVLYAPWVETLRKTKTAEVVDSGPRLFSVPVQDVLVPGGAETDVQLTPWLGLRFWLSKSQLMDRAKRMQWKNVESVSPAGSRDQVRETREALGRTQTKTSRPEKDQELYELLDVYCCWDVDGDGVQEDLLVTFDRSSRTILFVGFNKYDFRPVAVGRYQLRPHLFYGEGLPGILAQEQEAATEVLNYWILNMMISCTKFLVSQKGTLDENVRIYPFANIEVKGGTPQDVQVFPLGDVNPSGLAGFQALMAIAERKVGLNEMSSGGGMGTRTPGITALTMAQQTNRRFTAAFDSFRLMVADGVTQCLARDHEQVLAGNEDLRAEMIEVLGEAKADRIWGVLGNTKFLQHFRVQTTASSASINREADRQNGVLIFDRMLSYYRQFIELTQFETSGQVPPEMVQTLKDVKAKAAELVLRVLRTFPQMTDPEQFVLGLEATDGQGAGMAGDAEAGRAIEALMQVFGGASGGALEGFGDGQGLGSGVPPTGAI